jgi:2'-hydroxyisoflavone reductase
MGDHGVGHGPEHRVERVRILVLGGTQFLGRHVVDAALRGEHDVTLFNRGQTRPELFPGVEKLRGDRDGDLGALAGREFDAVVDTSGYVPRIVRRTIAALPEVGHYTFVSSVSVYADLSTPPTEASAVAELQEPTEEWREAYGELKADCEDVVRERFPDAFVPRPGLIVGPWDPTGRFTYWPERLAAGGRVLVPAPPEAPAQVIDVRDLAAWIVRAAENGTSGTYNAVDRATTRGALIETCDRVAGADAEIVWVDGQFLAEHDVSEWMELPLWLHDETHRGMLSIDPSPAFAAGLETRPLAETVRDTLAWVESGDAPADPPAGLDRGKEQRVLDAWLST